MENEEEEEKGRGGRRDGRVLVTGARMERNRKKRSRKRGRSKSRRSRRKRVVEIAIQVVYEGRSLSIIFYRKECRPIVPMGMRGWWIPMKNR